MWFWSWNSEDSVKTRSSQRFKKRLKVLMGKKNHSFLYMYELRLFQQFLEQEGFDNLRCDVKSHSNSCA